MRFPYTIIQPPQIRNPITLPPYFTFPITPIPNPHINKPHQTFYTLQHIHLSQSLHKIPYHSLTKNPIKY
ncbi:histidine decarboxylase, pyruvoyl type [Staphylococcus capitis]|uniref:histidine decarboxylase, pyruvoyl type n=1 Tax=Staphylococcus capitis TaxID=29388 RepID=UPI00370964CF